MNPLRLLILLVIPIVSPSLAELPDAAIDGVWLSGDGDGWIEVTRDGEDLLGSVLGSPNDDPTRARTDVNNPEPSLRNRPLLGLNIFSGFSYDGGGRWSGGTIYDPNSGKTYKCIVTLLDAETLSVRGYIGIALIGRTETWTRRASD